MDKPVTESPVIFGEVLFDCFPGGETVLGGAPFNVSWHLHAFGCNPLFISRIGGDTHGREIVTAMQDWGMNRQGLQTDPLLATGRVDITINPEGEPCYEICHPVAYDDLTIDGLPDLSPKTLKVPMVYHGSLALRSPENHPVFQALRERCPAPIFLDVNLRAPWWQKEPVLNLVKNADWVKLNHDELEALGTNRGSVVDQCRAWIDQYQLKGVILTLGANGAQVITTTECLVASPPRVDKVVDPVGAGDAFSSVFIMGLIQNWDLTQTLVRAQDFAAAIVGQRGATCANKALYDRFLNTWNNDQM